MAKTKKLLVQHLVKSMEKIAPSRLAEEWDNVGLQAGDPNREASKVMTALELTPEVINEAKKKKVGCIITHHPLIFRPVKHVAPTTTVNRMLCSLIEERIALIASHTNLDSVAWGTNGVIADLIDAQGADRDYLFPSSYEENRYIITVRVRVLDLVSFQEKLRNTVHKETVGSDIHVHILSSRSFGSFLKGEEWQEESQSVSIEIECTADLIPDLDHLLHSEYGTSILGYEKRKKFQNGEPDGGLGLKVNLKKESTVIGLAKNLKRSMKLRSIGVVGNQQKKVTRVGLLTGSGGMAVHRWKGGSYQVLITGEMSHHDCMEAKLRGLPVILLGHYESEVVVAGRVKELLTMALAEQGFSEFEIFVSESEESPVYRL